MASGGARNRSGPRPDPMSARSDSKGLAYVSLPAEGFTGKVPAFPLEALKDPETGRVSKVSRREKQIWREHWGFPQAVVWAGEPWRWPTLAQLCRLMAVVEFTPDSSAALVGQLHRFRDQLGLTPAGLKENGWQISAVPVAVVEPKEAKKPSLSGSRARVLKAVGEK